MGEHTPPPRGIRADPSMQIFWISVTVALSDTFLMFSIIIIIVIVIIIIIIIISTFLLSSLNTASECFAGVFLKQQVTARDLMGPKFCEGFWLYPVSMLSAMILNECDTSRC